MGARRHRNSLTRTAHTVRKKKSAVWAVGGERSVFIVIAPGVNKNLRVNTVKRCLPEALLGMWDTWRFLNNGW